jgi:thimet oligopeptidase
MWSEVLGLDMLSGFHGNMLDPAEGKRYRKAILEMGGQRPPQELVETFLGRKPNADAFFAEITGARD